MKINKSKNKHTNKNLPEKNKFLFRGKQILLCALVFIFASFSTLSIATQSGNGSEAQTPAIPHVLTDDTAAVQDVTPLAASGFWTDSGNYDTDFYSQLSTPGSYSISTNRQLAALAKYNMGNTITSAYSFSIANNIDFSDHYWTPIGYTSAKPFSGTFNGNDYTLSGLYANNFAYELLGLFGCLQSATVTHVDITSSTFESFKTGDNAPQPTGALSGMVCGTSTIAYCSTQSTVTVKGNYNIGGLIGRLDGTSVTTSSTISCSYNKASVKGINTYIGGIIGGVYKVSSGNGIYNCYNLGTVRNDASSGTLGKLNAGICGISDAYGDFGYEDFVIVNSYNAGNVSCGSAGTAYAVGGNGNYRVTNSYFDNQRSGASDNYSTGRNTGSMITQEMVNLLNSTTTPIVWGMDTDNINSGYPILLPEPGIKVTFGGITMRCQSVENALTTASGISGSSEASPIEVELDSDYTLAATATLTATNSPYVNFNGEGYTVSKSGAYSITIDSGATLNAADVKFDGNSQNASNITNNGTFKIVDGVTITKVSGTSTNVAVFNIGTFTMDGGTINNNTGAIAGAVRNTGIFTMSGGEIKDNSSPTVGAVLNSGTLTLQGGTISNNTATTDNSGGVHNTGTFNMNSGEIINNEAAKTGGGVTNTSANGNFTMSGGTISGNKANENGGGVNNISNATFTMSGGTISGNTATASGNGVYQNSVMNMGPSAVVSDTIYLVSSSRVVTLTGNLPTTGTNYTLAVPAASTAGTVLVDKSGGTGTISESELARFSLETEGYKLALADGKIVLALEVLNWQEIGKKAYDGEIQGFIVPSGSGTSADPYLITTPDQLAWVLYKVNGLSEVGSCFNISNNLDMTGQNHGGTSDTPIEWVPLGPTGYTGVVNGNKNTISKTTITGSTVSNMGFISSMNGATVQNLKFSGIKISMESSLASPNIGGVVGNMSNSTIKNCSVDGQIAVTDSTGIGGNIGGIAGNVGSGSILTYSNNKASVSTDYLISGGIAGVSSGEISYSYNTGSVSSSGFAGGIAGFPSGGTIKSCYNRGTISGTSTGGIAATSSATAISDCYNTMSATNSIAAVNSGTITNCYYNSDSTYTNTQGTAKTTEEMGGTGDSVKQQIFVTLLNGSTARTNRWYPGISLMTRPDSATYYVNGGSSNGNDGYPILPAYGEDISADKATVSGTAVNGSPMALSATNGTIPSDVLAHQWETRSNRTNAWTYINTGDSNTSDYGTYTYSVSGTANTALSTDTTNLSMTTLGYRYGVGNYLEVVYSDEDTPLTAISTVGKVDGGKVLNPDSVASDSLSVQSDSLYTTRYTAKYYGSHTAPARVLTLSDSEVFPAGSQITFSVMRKDDSTTVWKSYGYTVTSAVTSIPLTSFKSISDGTNFVDTDVVSSDVDNPYIEQYVIYVDQKNATGATTFSNNQIKLNVGQASVNGQGWEYYKPGDTSILQIPELSQTAPQTSNVTVSSSSVNKDNEIIISGVSASTVLSTGYTDKGAIGLVLEALASDDSVLRFDNGTQLYISTDGGSTYGDALAVDSSGKFILSDSSYYNDLLNSNTLTIKITRQSASGEIAKYRFSVYSLASSSDRNRPFAGKLEATSSIGKPAQAEKISLDSAITQLNLSDGTSLPGTPYIDKASGDITSFDMLLSADSAALADLKTIKVYYQKKEFGNQNYGSLTELTQFTPKVFGSGGSQSVNVEFGNSKQVGSDGVYLFTIQLVDGNGVICASDTMNFFSMTSVVLD